MNHSSLELPVAPEPDRPRSALVSAIVLLGVCSALFLTAPVLIRSMKALLSARSPGSWMPSLLEVGLGLLGVLALSSVVVGAVADLRSRLGSGRRRWRRRRRPWEEYLMEVEAQEDIEASLGDFPRLTRPKQIQLAPVNIPRSVEARPRARERGMATLRLVEATPWPLGSKHTSARNDGRLAPVTKLGFPASRPVAASAVRTCTPIWQEPAFQTPYPFSVWSYHDNRPDDFMEFYGDHETRSWLWAMLLFAGAALAATVWWRFYGLSLPFSV